MRTKTPGKEGYGNQCIYDKCGKLMTTIPTAGTADKCSPESPIGKHGEFDVYPYDVATELDASCLKDGDPPLKYQTMYYNVRPQCNAK